MFWSDFSDELKLVPFKANQTDPLPYGAVHGEAYRQGAWPCYVLVQVGVGSVGLDGGGERCAAHDGDFEQHFEVGELLDVEHLLEAG